jgi:hypothetical protein
MPEKGSILIDFWSIVAILVYFGRLLRPFGGLCGNFGRLLVHFGRLLLDFVVTNLSCIRSPPNSADWLAEYVGKVVSFGSFVGPEIGPKSNF